MADYGHQAKLQSRTIQPVGNWTATTMRSHQEKKGRASRQAAGHENADGHSLKQRGSSCHDSAKANHIVSIVRQRSRRVRARVKQRQPATSARAVPLKVKWGHCWVRHSVAPVGALSLQALIASLLGEGPNRERLDASVDAKGRTAVQGSSSTS